jgi:hypothetical protein
MQPFQIIYPDPWASMKTVCQPFFRVSQFLGVDRCGGGGVHYWFGKRKYTLSTFCVDNPVDELFLATPSRLFT